jgi:predicted nucleic acid-binding protein
MIVVDTNIIAYLYLESGRSSQVEQLLEKDAQWAAPLLWRSELRNVLALYIRKNLMSLVDAQQIMREAMLLMKGREYEVTSFQVMELVTSSDCSAYDCEFVALAEDLGTSLVTVDKKILKEFPQIAVSLDGFIVS